MERSAALFQSSHPKGVTANGRNGNFFWPSKEDLGRRQKDSPQGTAWKKRECVNDGADRNFFGRTAFLVRKNAAQARSNRSHTRGQRGPVPRSDTRVTYFLLGLCGDVADGGCGAADLIIHDIGEQEGGRRIRGIGMSGGDEHRGPKKKLGAFPSLPFRLSGRGIITEVCSVAQGRFVRNVVMMESCL